MEGPQAAGVGEVSALSSAVFVCVFGFCLFLICVSVVVFVFVVLLFCCLMF